MLDDHSKYLLSEYKERLNIYKKVKEIVVKELYGIISELKMMVNSVEARIKTEKSLSGKLELKGYKYKKIEDITDLVGARVVTFYSDEVDKIAALVEKKFIIDWDNSIDKRKMYDVNQFGYMSLHFICKIPKELYYDEAMPEINETPFEIQIKTTLQHAWATIHHDTGYKNDIEVPREYLRGLNRLAGILELADEEFKNIRTSLNEYRKKVTAIVKSGKYEDAELNGDTFKAYIETGVYDALNKKIAEIGDIEIVEVSLLRFLTVFKLLGFTTLKDVDDMRKKYQDAAYQFALSSLGGKDIDIISSSTGILALCSVYIIAQGYGEIGIKKMYETLYGERKSNDYSAKRAVEIANKIGLLNKD